MNLRRILAIVITAPVWVPLHFLSMVMQAVGATIIYGFTGKWKWSWNPMD